MAFVFIIIGVVILTSGVRGTSSDLWTLLQKDFSPSQQAAGQHSFVPWVASILVIGAIGYAKPLQTFSRSFLALVIIALLLSGQGATGKNFFASIGSAFSK